MSNDSNITVCSVHDKRAMNAFIRFPTELYRGDPNFVAHLFWERKDFFNPAKNPLFNFTDVEYFRALNGQGEMVGRISAHINHRYNNYWDVKTGCFGFFECVPKFRVAEELFSEAERWLRERGVTTIQGPYNFSTNEECGLLVDGFDIPPAVMMPYGKPYYSTMLTHLGYEKAKDLIAFNYDYKGAIPEYLVRFNDRLRERTGVTIRRLKMDNFGEEIEKALRIYNDAWQDNWGFVPMTDEQFRHMASELKPVIDPDVALIAE
ncbi:MAG: N-acetyltransferase, partial [Planctomycetota bacterium]